MEQIKIDIVPVGVAPVAHASQFDNSRQIRFNLFNQGTPYTLTGAETVTMVVNGEEESITNTSDNYVIWDVAEEDCGEVGVIGCEIRIVLGSMLIGSKNFFLEVEMDPYNGKNVHVITVGPADICTFETTLPEPLQSVIVDVEATGGNGTPDNPNPINGYSSANIKRCGANLFDNDNLTIARSPYASMTFDKATYLKAGTYTASISNIDNATSWRFGFKFFDKSGNIITNAITNGYVSFVAAKAFLDIYDNGNVCLQSDDTTGTSVKITLTSDIYIVACIGFGDTGASTTLDYQIETGSTATDFTPYNGQTYAIAFGQTVYGGVLDVTRGKLHVTWLGDTINNLPFQYWAGGVVFYADITDKKNGNTNVISDIYETLQNGGYGELSDGQIVGRSDGSTIYIKDTAYTDVSAFKSARGNGLIVYELATPFDIDLTPEVISAIVGENNVFADTGDIEVKYLDRE